ncbi:protein FAM200A-like [Galendromus occidentalis]|uniref:Protein FAM200A-like n=1 Tax=Galendromus occidentalis TaxID=34638 RepID=A0AAJ6QTW0_9ACAR|nr:protein FAM200A-like [Galendromus occidentalis]
MASFLLEKKLTMDDSLKQEIAHLDELNEKFSQYFHEEMEDFTRKAWVVSPFESYPEAMSTLGQEKLIDLSNDRLLKSSFKREKALQFWLSVRDRFPRILGEASRLLIPFPSSYMCEVGFSALVSIKSKYRNRLLVPDSLRLKLTKTEVDTDKVMNESKE